MNSKIIQTYLEVVAHSGCPVVKGAPAPGWIGDWSLG